MKLFSIICFFFLTGTGIAQSHEFRLLQASGEMPSFLEEIQASNFFIPEPMETVRGDYRYGQKEHHLLELYKSGMIVYGDSVSAYCSQLAEKIGYPKPVYCVKSRYSAVFSNPAGELFITTGLFSQLTNEAELAFFLSREILAVQQEIPQTFGSKNKEEKTLESTIKKLASRHKREKDIDSLAFDYLLKKTPYSKNELLTSFDILLYSGIPFYETKIDWNYFNTNQLFVPENELMFLYKKKNFDYYKPQRSRPDLVQRKQEIIRKFAVVENEKFTESYLLNRDFFNGASLIAREDDILNDIIHTHFHEALYEIYVLESMGNQGFYLDYLKAQAWIGILGQKLSYIRQNQYNDYEFSDNEGALFCRFIRSQPEASVAALSIRMLYDLHRKYPAVKTFGILFSESLKLAAGIPEFKINSFQKKNYREYLKSIGQEPQKADPANTDNRKIQFEIQKAEPFYLYILPDLVADPQFLNMFDSLAQSRGNQQQIAPEALAIKSFYLRSHTREKKAHTLLDQQNREAISALSQIPLLEERMKMSATEAYNRKSVFNATIIQSYSHNKYKKSIYPVLAEKLVDSGTDKPRSYCIGKYENQFKPRMRGIYFTGLFVVPLPYLIPEFFYSGHHSLFASFYFNAQTGQMEGVSYNQFKDPCNRFIFRNILFQSLNSTYKKP